MNLYSQRDPRWRGEIIGQSGKTMGQIGCTVTALAMLSTYFGIGWNPQQMLRRLNFTNNGLVIWESVKYFNWKFAGRVNERYDRGILDAMEDPNRAVLLQVADHSHWVVGTGNTWPYNIFKIADPIDGKKATMMRYQNNITGAAFFART